MVANTWQGHCPACCSCHALRPHGPIMPAKSSYMWGGTTGHGKECSTNVHLQGFLLRPNTPPPPPRPLTRVVKGNAAQSTHATQWGHPVKIIIKAATRQRVGAMPPTHRCTLRRQQVVHTRWHVCPCFTAFQHAATNLGTMHCRIPLPSWRPCTKYRLHLQRPTLTAQPAQHC